MGRLIKLNAAAADSPFLVASTKMRTSMTATFAELLTSAATLHANEIQLRAGDESPDQVVAMVRGDSVLVAELAEGAAADFLAQAFSACDGADDYRAGAGRMMRLTGERLALPKGIAQVLMQFLPPGGARQLVARISYDGDVCCGSCGGA